MLLQDLKTDFTLGSCFSGGVKWIKNADPDKYLYSGHGIGFDPRGYHPLPDGSVGKNGIIFGADMSSSVHIDNKRKDTLILGKGSTQGLNHILTAEAQYLINLTRLGIKFCLSLHDNGSSNCLFVNATKIYQFKAKDSETKNTLCA